MPIDHILMASKVTFSPDGKKVAAGYETGSVKILETSSGKAPYALGGR
ncbi:MAG: hypothetical protein AB2L14_37285 [Candidatus Xenobiia bacterium LiM19]